ncbi:unnamed protein product [Cyclocybe aegerita]|uniref:DUF6533 domain-containing protein n=1 Tax=Cyclocybe aegerita TaxID=1973307 RepID=A0A8S0W0W2_CYCAE|nr:unnamed protein product [Cyclocybe aegerita]
MGSPFPAPVVPSASLSFWLRLRTVRATMDSVDVALMQISIRAKMVDLASAVVFLWDYLLTIGMEVIYVWPSPWTGMKVIYFIQQYLPFIDTLWIAVQGNQLRAKYKRSYLPRIERCWEVSHVFWIGFIGATLIESFSLFSVILTFRAWAVWDRHRVLTILLPILFLGCCIPPPIILGLFIPTTEFQQLPPPLSGCVLVRGYPIVAVAWILLLVWDALILTLMVISAIKAYRYRGNSALYRVVYGEGIIYYFYLFGFSAVNIVLLHLGAVDTSYRFMLTSRVLLHIRKAGLDRDADEVEHITLSIARRLKSLLQQPPRAGSTL